MKGLLVRISHLRACRTGIASIEFAIVAMFMTVTLLGVIDLGKALNQSIRLQSAIRAGAQYALSYPTDGSGITTRVKNAVSDWTNVTVTPSGLQCACTATTVSCTGSCTGVSMSRGVTISVTRPFTPLLLSFMTSLSASAYVGVQ